jgi:hypothetical protein
MQRRIRIGVPAELFVVRNFHPAEPHRIAGLELMKINAHADTHLSGHMLKVHGLHSVHYAFSIMEIARICDLDVVGGALCQGHRQPRPFGDRRIVRERPRQPAGPHMCR